MRNWIQIDLAGEDETVALKLLDREIGLAPISTNKVERFSNLKGRIIDSDKATTSLRIDVGVFEPRVCDAVVSHQRLQAQLTDGKNVPLQSLVKLFCLNDFMPLLVKIVSDLDDEKGVWQAELSEMQLSIFSGWLRSSLDRLIVLGASNREVELAVERSRHFRDVIRIEALGLGDQAIVCKLGTDAVGLVPKIGPYMRHAFLAPFSPRKVREEIDRQKS